MRRILALALVVLLYGGTAFAQSTTGPIALTAGSSDCSTSGSCAVLTKSADDGTVAIQISGTFSGTLQFEGLIQLVNSVSSPFWASFQCFPQGGGASVSSTTSTGNYQCPAAALTGVRARMSSYSSGTATVFLQKGAGSIASGGTVTVGGQPVAVVCNVTNCPANANQPGSNSESVDIAPGLPVSITGLTATYQTVLSAPGYTEWGQCTNSDTNWAYVQFFNSLAPTVGTTAAAPRLGIPPGGGSLVIPFIQWTTGLTIAGTSTPTGSSGATANTLVCNFVKRQ